MEAIYDLTGKITDVYDEALHSHGSLLTVPVTAAQAKNIDRFLVDPGQGVLYIDVPLPEITPLQKIENSGLELIDGEYHRAWKIVDRFSDIPGGATKSAQESECLAQLLNDAAQEKQNEVNRLFESEMGAVRGDVVQDEVDTFATQEKEAEAYIADNQANVPLLSGLAVVRGITVADLANRVMDHATRYKAATAQIMGKKHKFEDQIKAAKNLEDFENIEVI